MRLPDVTVFGPNPLLSITVEPRAGGGDDVHVHAAGQGVWVARTAATLGAHPDLCGFVGGETGHILTPLLKQLGGTTSLVSTTGSSGSYVIDRREDTRRLIAQATASRPSRHELDDLVSRACASASGTGILAVCNPYPGEALPVDVYRELVVDARALGAIVIADLSTPRLDAALAGKPDLVKLNDWELAEFVCGPVTEQADMDRAIRALLDGGASTVLLTRAEQPAIVARGDEVWEIVPPPLACGWREGCGDTMFGAIAAGIARGLPFEEWLRLGAAAGAAAFLRRGLGSVRRDDVEAMVPSVEVRHPDANGGLTRSPRRIASGPRRASQSR